MGGELLLAEADAGAGFFERGRHGFDLNPSLGQSSFLSFSAFETGEFLVLEAVCFGGFKGNFVLDGGGLLRGLNGVELGTEADALLAMLGNFAFEAGAKRFLAGQNTRGFGCQLLGGCEGAVSLGEFGGQGAGLLSQAGSFQFDGLQLYEVFNQLLHLCQEGYGIGHV